MQEKAVRVPHNVILEDRKLLSISGVNDIDSFDDLKDFMYTKGDTEYKWRMNTVEVQLVVNDNANNDGFRKASMVVVTDWNESPSDKKDAANLTGATIGGLKAPDDFAIPAASGNTNIATLTEKAAKNAKISFAYEGAKIKVELNSNEITNGSSHELKETDVIKVTVSPADSESPAKVYTFTIGALVPASYANTTVIGLNVDSGNGYTDTDWNDGTNVTLDTSAKTFDFPFLQTGDAEKDEAQIKEAVAFYNETNEDDIVLSNLRKVGSIWYLSANGVDMSFDPSSSKKLAYVKANAAATAEAHIVDSSDKVNAIVTAGTGIPSVKEPGKAEEPLTAALTGIDIVAGAEYTVEAYTKVNVLAAKDTAGTIAGTAGTTADYTYTVAADEGVIKSGSDWYMKGGQKITVTITIDDFDNIATTLATATDTITVKGATGLTVAPAAGVEFGASTTEATATITVTAPATPVAAVTAMAMNGETA